MAFIWSNKDQRYLGVSVSSNDEGEFCNSVSAELTAYGAPHAFESVERAHRCLAEEMPWYNSGLECPMRRDYSLNNCKIVEVQLDPSPLVGMEIQRSKG